jgi:hypothetical protein
MVALWSRGEGGQGGWGRNDANGLVQSADVFSIHLSHVIKRGCRTPTAGKVHTLHGRWAEMAMRCSN